MKISHNIGRTTVELESDTIKDAFAQLSTFQEVFGEDKCGKCGSENLRFVVRENDGNAYYEVRCQECGAKLSFGANKVGGGLFPRRKDSDGNWLSDRGWQKWNPKTKKME